MQLEEQDLSNDTEDYDFENITPKFFTDERVTPESHCGIDQRIKQVDTSRLPYKAICKLYMKAANGSNFIGTGFLTHQNKLMTAGHCVYDHSSGGWMQSIIVVPGKSGLLEPYGRYTAERAYASAKWINNRSVRHDMGAIKLRSSVSHSDVLSTTTTDANEATVCGYPSDRDTGIFQYRMRDMVREDDGRFFYQIDTFGGQSGAPLLANSATAIGIHNYGGCDNKASDLTQEFIDRVGAW
ncbi:trypsin-like serine peptidase [Yoonia sp. 2307UL14-13]|uniref:trypsin-like serine peptidase n=1 Tax=Yoonia sp. 2307UL14-13 TaxID=3126506 RepID=UPI0030B75F3B